MPKKYECRAMKTGMRWVGPFTKSSPLHFLEPPSQELWDATRRSFLGKRWNFVSTGKPLKGFWLSQAVLKVICQKCVFREIWWKYWLLTCNLSISEIGTWTNFLTFVLSRCGKMLKCNLTISEIGTLSNFLAFNHIISFRLDSSRQRQEAVHDVVNKSEANICDKLKEKAFIAFCCFRYW